jgi:hypothetical protein|nr:MAG TPA: hypothetical protein [Caudoviricetes sp.]
MGFKIWVIAEAISIVGQFVLFIPFYMVWKEDCRTIGKDNLAVSLKERFFAWCFYFPIWLMPLLMLSKEQ